MKKTILILSLFVIFGSCKTKGVLSKQGISLIEGSDIKYDIGQNTPLPKELS